jgi:hypothetical protein
MIRAWIFVLALFVGRGLLADTSDFHVSAEVELGPDRGQNPGTLFEIVDSSGRITAGAGVAAVYNTQSRSARELLQVFVNPPDAAQAWRITRMPPVPSRATGFYPFTIGRELYIDNRSEKGRSPNDQRVYRWDEKDHAWVGTPDVVPFAELVAGEILAVTSEAVRYGERVLLRPEPGAFFGEHYFAQGKLFIKESNRQATPPLNRLIVCRWRPEIDIALEHQNEWTQELPIDYEFIYAFGQLQDQVLAVSNNGRILRFADEKWSTLRTPPVPAVSYQVYSILTFGDRLLLGQYPTGEIFEYSGGELLHRKGWPPTLQGVSLSAREAQTLAWYGGDMFAGVWPWAELWRRDTVRNQWSFVQRMFEHPLATNAVVHPYENETKRTGQVLNLWGQRITGLQPFGTDLIITTSSKTGAPYTEEFNFLSKNQQADYGAIYRATLPGCLAVPIERLTGPTRIEVRLTGANLVVLQDGRLLGQTTLPKFLLEALNPDQARWGDGSFGPWTGQVRAQTLQLGDRSR